MRKYWKVMLTALLLIAAAVLRLGVYSAEKKKYEQGVQKTGALIAAQERTIEENRRYAKGRFRELSKLCDYVRVQSIRIEAPEELLVNVDGEAMRDSVLEMTVVPRGLNFIFPAKMAYFENESKEFEEIMR